MKIAVLSTHGWDQQHYNSEGKRVANIGDSIREVVMMDILKENGLKEEDIVVLSQAELSDYKGEVVRLIYDDMINDDSVIDGLAKNEKINPVFVSCFFYDDIFLNRPDRVAFFKEHEPIGCRDEHSKELCQNHGIDAYLVGCFTICLPKKTDQMGRQIYIVDANETLLSVIPEEVKKEAIFISHAVEIMEYPITAKESMRLFNLGKKMLDEYRENARLVISGRMHAALPAFAMGIPAIIINQNFNYKFSWLDKWLKLYDEDTCKDVRYDFKIDSQLYQQLDNVRNLIKSNIRYAVETGKNDIHNLQEIDNIYANRKKCIINGYFKKQILNKLNTYKKEDIFNYVIWGAGLNGGYIYQIMREMFPNAKLVAIIDKYKTGNKYGVPLIKKNDLSKYNVDYVIISSKPAIEEASAFLDNYMGSGINYSIAVTQQTC